MNFISHVNVGYFHPQNVCVSTNDRTLMITVLGYPVKTFNHIKLTFLGRNCGLSLVFKIRLVELLKP